MEGSGDFRAGESFIKCAHAERDHRHSIGTYQIQVERVDEENADVVCGQLEV